MKEKDLNKLVKKLSKMGIELTFPYGMISKKKGKNRPKKKR